MERIRVRPVIVQLRVATMAGSEITPELRSFLRERIHSHVQLELLLLVRQTPSQAWSLDQIGERLKVPEGAALEAISGLRGSGLLEMVSDGGIEFTVTNRRRRSSQGSETNWLVLSKRSGWPWSD
jgi:hypothetical protein